MAEYGAPKYQRIAAEIRADIAAGRHRPGERIPSETELMERFGVTRPTVRGAVQVLQVEGLVESFHGRGSFVRRVERQVIPLHPDGTPGQARTVLIARPATIEEAEQHGLRPGGHVVEVTRQLVRDGGVVEVIGVDVWPADRYAFVDEHPAKG
ncbi:MAG TPA: GntR family transcriptional regulator [Kineosporiaceae bacterium]|nr:GntR family transcriptional regulator [Kineosporiaceae bacterium]